MGSELMVPKIDRTTRILSGVASPVTTNHAVKGSMFVKLKNTGNLKIGPRPPPLAPHLPPPSPCHRVQGYLAHKKTSLPRTLQ